MAAQARPQPVAATASTQCERCFFRFVGKSTCAAFPNGIPAIIALGHFRHTEPYAGDNGIRFLPRWEVWAFARMAPATLIPLKKNQRRSGDE
jgi:hypothetical protein